jgi:hypothetical protein
MQINTVIGIATLNQYAECVPYFIRAWRRVFPGIHLCIVLVANRIPQSMLPYRDFIHLVPLGSLPPTISREEAARQLRYLFPPYYHGLSPRVKEGLSDTVIVSNITMLPIKAEPYEAAAALYDDATFLQMLDAQAPETDEPFPPRYTIATTETWLKLYGNTKEDRWNWNTVAQRFQVPFNQILLESPLYPNQTRVVGTGRVNYDPGVSDLTLQLPIASYYAEWEERFLSET